MDQGSSYTKSSKLCLYFVGIDHRVVPGTAGYYLAFPPGRPVVAGWPGGLRCLWLGPLARIDVLSINACGGDLTTAETFIPECLDPPLVCAPINEGHRFEVIST